MQDEINKFINDSKKYYKKPTLVKKILHVLFISILISTIIILITIPLALYYGNEYFYGKENLTKDSFVLGFPLKWFKINYLQLSNNLVIDKVYVMDWYSLAFDFIAYLSVFFISIYFIYYILIMQFLDL